MRSHWQDTRSTTIAAAAIALVGFGLFQFFGNVNRGYIDTASVFYWWTFQWTNPGSETQHGWLILGLSAWLLRRNVISAGRLGQFEICGPQSAISRVRNPKSEIAAPAAAMLGGLALHALGFAAQQTRLSIVAFLLFTWGVLRLGCGRRWGAAAAFPLGFMAFSIPINFLDSLGFWLRMGVADASAAIAHAAGIGVLKSGTQLTAPDGAYNYDVAAACSGIRSLTAMTALSLLAGYLNFHSWSRRTLVLLLCFPLVLLGNIARIVAIILAARLGGPKWGDLAHEVMGYGVFAIVLGGVLLAVQMLRRRWPETPRAVDHRLDDKPVRHPIGDKAAWVTAGIVVTCVVAEMFLLHHLAQLPARGSVGVQLATDGRNPVELPAFLGIEWTGRPQPVSPVEREILPPDTGFSRRLYFNHRDPSKLVLLSIVLSGRDRSSIHRPELCLVGQGWTIRESITHRFNYPGRPDAGFPAMLLRVQREVQTPRGKQIVPQLVTYWFVGGDCVVATHWQRMLRDAWNRVAHARSDRWAYVLMQTDASDGEAAALARMQAILDATLPVFQKPIAP